MQSCQEKRDRKRMRRAFCIKTIHISPSYVISRHVVTYIIINLNDSVTLQSERTNPLIVAPAVLSGNEIVAFKSQGA